MATAPRTLPAARIVPAGPRRPRNPATLKRASWAVLTGLAAWIGLAPPSTAQQAPAEAQAETQAPQAPAAPARPAVITVMDGSGSMWGGLGSDGTSKLLAARQGLEAVMDRLARSHRLGLATFGPGCRAAELALPPTDTDAAGLAAALDRFNPRGKGPLVAGLDTAAEAIGANGTGHVILLHDGLDNCGEDACAAAASLKASHPGVTISTVSLGMEPSEVAAIACLASTTGGRTLTADDPAGVTRALSTIADAITTVAPSAASSATANTNAAPQTPDAAQPEPPRTDGPPRLVATARLAADGPAITMPLSWRVTDPATGKLVHEAVAASLSLPLAAAPVRIEAESGRIKVGRETTIAAAGDTTVDLVLDAGIVRFDTGTRRLASDAEEPLIRLETVSTAPPQAAAQPSDAVTTPRTTPLWIARGKAIEALLPPGDYRVIAEYGLARTSAPVSVRAGQQMNLVLPLEAGRLEMSTTPASLTDVVYQISIDDPEQPGGRRQLARTAHRAPAYVLSTGTYTITATAAGEAIRRVVAVRSGEVTRDTLAFDLASLEVAASLNGAPPGRQPLTLRIAGKGAQSAPQVIAPGRPHHLKPGTYLLTLSTLEGARTTREVRLAAGEQASVKLDLATAELRLDMAGGAAERASPVCELITAERRQVWRSVAAEPRALLDPGAYTLRCQAGETRRELSLTLAAGQTLRLAPFAQP